MATTTSLLQDHVTLEVRSVDRIFLHAYVPRLQTQYQVIRFLLDRGYPIPSPAALGKIGKGFVRHIQRFCSDGNIPVVRFRKKEDQEQIAAPYFAQAREQGRYSVVMVGVRQETANVWTGWREGGSDAHPHFEYSRQSKFVNHYYVYILDRQFGPVFFKLMAYAPYSVWIWCNANEWAKCQAQQAGIAYAALDNGFASCSDPVALQKICDRFSAAAIRSLCERWLHRLPTPFTSADRQRGYWYDYALRQFEVSDTRMFDRPASARAWFEGTIREHLDLGRPDRVSVVFNRRINRRTPGRFSTRVITQGVDPSIYIKYKASKLKQYMKLGRALRTETVINNTRDFGIGRRVTKENLQALRAVGEAANRHLIELEVSSSPCAPDADTLRRVVLPSVENGLPAPGLRFGDPRVMALLAALACFTHVVAGFTNATLRALVAAHLGRPYTARQMTYDLRRLTRKRFIERVGRTHRYRLTPPGRTLSVFFTKTYLRVVTPSLAQLDPTLPDDIARRSPLGRAWRDLDRTLDDLLAAAGIAA